MSFNPTEAYIIPLRSWPRAQQPTTIRSSIGQAVVVLCAIELYITLIKRAVSESLADSSVLMRQRFTLYDCIACVDLKSVSFTDIGSSAKKAFAPDK